MRAKSQHSSLFEWLGLLLPYPILIWFYLPILHGLWSKILNDENYSFGLLLPFVVGFIIYRKWPQIQRTVLKPTWLGLVVMVIGFILNFFWILGGVVYLGYLSLFLVIIGLLMLQGGFRLIRILAFPIFLVFIMLPLPETLVKAVTFRLQLLSSFLAARTLEYLGYPVFLQGNIIDLGYRKLQVVEACSGMGYLISALVLGFIFCYFFQRRSWKVLILLLSIFPATILANVIRLVSIAFFPILQAGVWHVGIGLVIFILVFYYLVLINWILNTLSPPPVAPPVTSAPAAEQTPSPRSQASHYLYNLAGLALVILAIPITFYLSQTKPVPLVQNFDRFPLKIGNWEGSRSYIDPTILKVLGTDEYFEATYVNPQHGPVSLWIAYYADHYREKGLFHNPLTCMVGGGWNLVREQQSELAPGLSVRNLLIERSGVQQMVYYWYLQGNRWLASEYSLKIYLGLDAIFSRRNNGALIRLITPASPSAKEAQERLRLFARSLLPVMQQFFHIEKHPGTAVGKERVAGKPDHG
jgi:exosortase D (VPLPA-CTERM-specific)